MDACPAPVSSSAQKAPRTYTIEICERCQAQLSFDEEACEYSHPQPYCWDEDASPPLFQERTIEVVSASGGAQLRAAAEQALGIIEGADSTSYGDDYEAEVKDAEMILRGALAGLSRTSPS